MLKTLLCATLAVSAVPAVAAASPRPGSCPRTDPRGDVQLTGGVTVDAPHLDIVGYDLSVGSAEAVAVIRTLGSGHGRWSLMVSSGAHRYYFSAGREETIDDPRTSHDDTATRFYAYVGDGGDLPVRGSISDGGEIRVRVRLKDFGAKAPRRGARPRAFSVWAYQRLSTPNIQLRDSAGSTC